MSGPIAPADVRIGDMIGTFQVKRKLGEGACGQVYLMHWLKDGKLIGRAAMKVEPRMQKKEDEILRMELFVLQRLQNSPHFTKILGNGVKSTYSYLIMTLLGREIHEIRRRQPKRLISKDSILRIGIQLIKGLQDIHEAGFVHRDTKPSNMAVGYRKPSVVYIFDFGLARQILLDDPKNPGQKVLRPPRSKIMFRGTPRYCSLNVHRGREQGRHDDLYGVLFSMIECVTGTLPWKSKRRKESEKIKESTTDEALCKGCPNSFLEMAKKLRGLTYSDVPPYLTFLSYFKKDLNPKLKMTDPYEWTKPGRGSDDHWDDKTKVDVSEKEHAEKDNDPTVDNKTSKDMEESINTEDSDSTNEFDPLISKEDTLDLL